MAEQVIKLEQEFEKIGQTLTESVANDKYSSNYYYTEKLTAILNSIDKDNLKANVTLKNTLISRYIAWSQDDITFSVGVNDEIKASKTVNSGGNANSSSTSKTYVEWTGDIPYNEDGTLTVTLFAKTTGHGSTYAPPNQSAEIVAIFPFIPRESSISSIDGEYLGSAVTVVLDRKIDEYVHKVEYSFAGSSYTTVTSSGGTSVSFTPPLSLASNIPNTTSGSLAVRVTTLNGSTQIGDVVTSSIALKLPDSVVPSFTSITADTLSETVPSSWGLFVRTHSSANVKINGAKGIYGSTITSYLISGGGFSGAESSLETGVFNTSGTVTFTGTVTDSRGRTASKTISITVVDYNKPSISVSANRCDANGNLLANGTYLKVTAKYSYSKVENKNTIERSVYCNGVENTSFESGASFVLNCNVIATSSYQLTASISDALEGYDSKTIKIATASVIAVINEDKNGIVFGTYEVEENKFKVDMPLYFHKDLDMNGQKIKNVVIEAYDPSGGESEDFEEELIEINNRIDSLSEEIDNLKNSGSASAKFDEETGELTITSNSIAYDDTTGNLTI